MTAAANLVRLAIVFFGSAYYSSRLGVPMGFQIASVLAIDTISFLVVVKCSYQISRGQGSSQQINSLGINKLPLSIVMVINGIILFSLGVAILQERWTTYYTLSIHYHGVVVSYLQ